MAAPKTFSASKTVSTILDNTMVDATHYRQRLNNYLQKVYREKPSLHLAWETSYDGPGNQPIWLAIAHIHDIEFGRGRGPSRGLAMEDAAKCVLITLGVPLQGD